MIKISPDDTPTRLTLTRAAFLTAAQAADMTPQQAHDLWDALARGPQPPAPEVARFSFGHALYYFGGLLTIAAMSLFMTWNWAILGSWGVCILASLYALACWSAAEVLNQRGYPIPAGLLGALAVFLVPLATWAGQHALGLWPESNGPISGDRFYTYHLWLDRRWLSLEIATLAAGALALWRLRRPFLVMPIALTLWYMSVDLTSAESFVSAQRVSIVFGLALCLVAGMLDLIRRTRGTADYATWLYLFGAISAWSAVTATDNPSALAKLAYALVNGVLVLFGAAIGRRIFTILGAIGVTLYLGYLAFQLFQDSLMFPLALTAIGFALVMAGLWWQRHAPQLQRRLRAVLTRAPGVSP